MLFSNVKIWLVGIAVVAVVTSIGLGYKHYSGLLATVDVLTATNAKLETSISVQGVTIDAQESALGVWQNSQANLLARVDEMLIASTEATSEARRLHEIFAQHDLSELAKAKPGLIENRINSGSDRIGSLLECASGSSDPSCSD